jgi:ribonuclease VapC
MFLDASAIVAIMTNEPDADEFAAKIEAATTPLRTSPIGVLESALAYSRKKESGIEAATEAVHEFLQLVGIQIMSITPEVGKRACEAYAQFGARTGHKAQLNLGDVFAYGCAKYLRVPLLYKGNDFPHTDLG